MVFGKKIDLPLPPLADLESIPTFNNTPVTIILIDNNKLEGKLTKFDNTNSVIGITLSDTGENRDISMDSTKSFYINVPLQLTADPKIQSETSGVITTFGEPQQFLIIFKDRSKLRGKTFGTRVDKNGIHLFKQHDNNLYLQQYVHVFIPKTAIENNLIGDQIGQILVKEQKLSKNVVQEALEEQFNDRSKPIGEYLLKNKVVNSEQLENALMRQKAMPNLRLGEILVSEHLIDEYQLQESLDEQKKKRKKPLGEILVEKNIVSKEKIQQALAKKLGIPFVNLHEFKIPVDIIALIPANLAFKHKIIPLYQFEGKIAIAIENPMDWQALDAVRFHTNKYIEPVMAMAEEINWGLQFYYSSDDILHSIGPSSFEEDEEDENINESEFNTETFSHAEESEVADNIIVKIINKIILDANQQGVSDIHIEPNNGKQKIVVRFRKDGTLHVYHKFPSQYRNAIVSRVKVMARLDISERRKPQDGKIRFSEFGPANIELRVATLPTSGGLEDVVMRILSSGKNIPINALGLTQKNTDRLLEAISKPYGLFLVCGPTGSGKTTTLHSVLGQLNDTERKIWTAEDPVEITQPGLRQVQINPKIGLTFANALRAFLRADPDIIMIGEMRDEETAGMGIEASLTGHLVLSTLHTNSASESVVRLLDMGMDPFNFADALIGILAQRLAKTLCMTCKTPYHPNEKEIWHLAMEYCRELLPEDATDKEKMSMYKKQIDEWVNKYSVDNKFTLYKAPGCKECNETGYRGRIGLHELLVATPEIKHMILEGKPATAIHKRSLKEGMRTLKQDGIEKVLQGYTDFPQIRTVCIK